ncbi:MAG: hypothetical protein AABN95_26670 [Acidobacteriota bacterium]
MQPIIIEDSISIAANSVNDNVIVSNASLRRYLRAPFAAQGKLLAVGSAAGLRISLDYGSKNVVGESDLRVGTDLQEPLDVLSDAWYPNEGDQLVLRCANSTGGALDLRYRIMLTAWDGDLPPDCRVMQRGPISVAAAAVDVQLLDGLRYERAPVDSMMEIFMTASASGLKRQCFVDTESIAPPSAIPPLNRIPQDPFDKNVEGIEVPADKQIELSVSNPTGGAVFVSWKQKLQELVRA